MKKRKTVSISARALIQRINRKLKADGEKLKAARGSRTQSQVGDFFIVDTDRNLLVAENVGLVELGRELKVLAEWESLDENAD